MELESPADAWYVWLGVAVVSFAIAGIVISLPSGPPPDSTAAVNEIDRVAGSSYDAKVTIEHDAAAVRIGEKQLSMRNEHGTTHGSISFGTMVPVADNENLEKIVHGTDPADHYGSDWKKQFDADIETASMATRDPEWHHVDGDITVRSIPISTISEGNTHVTIVDV